MRDTHHEGFSGNVITNDRTGRPAVKSDNVWGVAFYARHPWPELMCVADYDVGNLHGEKTFRFDVENGYAVYEILGQCQYGCAWHGKLIESKYEEITRGEEILARS